MDVKKPEGSCENIDDENCPFCGSLPVRGRVFEGEVVSDDMEKTVVVSWEYAQELPKYERLERRNTKVYAHNPEIIDAKKGDEVKIAECRPISKTKRFVVVEKLDGDAQ